MLAALLSWPYLDATAQQQPPDLVSRSLAATAAGIVLGRGVVDSEGEDVGPLVDVLVDTSGHPIAGVIDVGGFLGVGKRRVAVAWRLLHFVPESGVTLIHMDLTFDSAAAAAEFQGPDNTFLVIDHPPP